MLPITPIPRSAEFIEGVVNLRGLILIVMELSKRLDLKPAPRSDKNRIVVVEIDNNSVGMIVDEVTEVLRMPKDQIVKTPELSEADITKKYITGIGKLDNRLIILIDLAAILSQEELDHVETLKQKEALSNLAEE